MLSLRWESHDVIGLRVEPVLTWLSLGKKERPGLVRLLWSRDGQAVPRQVTVRASPKAAAEQLAIERQQRLVEHWWPSGKRRNIHSMECVCWGGERSAKGDEETWQHFPIAKMCLKAGNRVLWVICTLFLLEARLPHRASNLGNPIARLAGRSGLFS